MTERSKGQRSDRRRYPNRRGGVDRRVGQEHMDDYTSERRDGKERRSKRDRRSWTERRRSAPS